MQGTGFNFNELAGGALEEALLYGLQEVMNNIDDPNTPAKASRKLVLTVTFKPNDSRTVSETELSVKTTLAPAKAITTTLLMERDGKGQMIASEMYGKDHNQGVLPLEDGVVVPIGQQAKR